MKTKNLKGFGIILFAGILASLAMVMFSTTNSYANEENEYGMGVFKITYDANGADAGKCPDSQSGFFNSEIQLHENTGNLQKSGFIFTGWNTKSDGAGDHYAEGSVYRIVGSTKLYAEWTFIPKRINFKGVNGRNYYPIFNSVPEGVHFYDDNGCEYTTMHPNITYATVSKETPITAVRSINNVRFNEVFEGEERYCPPNEGWVRTNLVYGENLVYWPWDGRSPREDASVQSVLLDNIWNTYKDGIEGFGSESGSFWSNHCNWMKDGALWRCTERFCHGWTIANIYGGHASVCIARTFK